MKNNQGFISILCLILLGLVIVIGISVEYSSMLRSKSLSASNHSLQSYYLAEGKIYMSLYEDEYYKNQLYVNIGEFFKKYPFSTSPKNIRIKQEDLMKEDSEDSVAINIMDTDSLKEIQLVAKSNYNKITSKVIAQGKIFNELFYLENFILSKEFLNDSMKNKLEEFLYFLYENISINFYKSDSSIYNKEIHNYDKLYIDNMGSYKKIDINEHELPISTDSFTNSQIIIIAKSHNSNGNVVIGELSNNITKLSGILFIEGDLYIKSDFEFNGILILKNGSIYMENDAKFKLRGLVIGDNIINYDFIDKTDIIYSRDYLYKYCIYLPGIIDIDINLIKSE